MDAKNIHEPSFSKVEILLLKHIFKHYKERYNPRQLARLLDLNHAHVNKLCSGLVKKGLLVSDPMGNAVFYRFDYDGKLAMHFMEYVLGNEPFPEWLKIVRYNLSKLDKSIELGLLFGSSLKTTKFNDIDVFLMYQKEKSKDIQKVKDDIRKAGLVDKPIRYLEMTENDVKMGKGDSILYNVISDSRVFYNPSKFVEVVNCLR